MTRRTSTRDLLIAAGVLAGAFAALTVYVRTVGPLPGDKRAFRYVVERDPPQALLDLENVFQSLGTPVAAAFTVLAAAVVLWRRRSPRDAVAVVVASLIVLVENPLSDLIGTTDAAREAGFPHDGYPSGHTTYAAATFGAVGALSRAAEARVIAALLVLGMAVTRITGGNHLPNEVLGGLLLGGAWLSLVLAVHHRSGSR